MGTAYIDVTITAEEGGISLFETECVAEVEYVTSGGDLDGWHIADFRFDQVSWFPRPVGGDRPIKKKTGEVWCPDDLRPVLLRYVDKTAVEEALAEHLYSTGELTYANEGLRADYRAAVL